MPTLSQLPLEIIEQIADELVVPAPPKILNGPASRSPSVFPKNVVRVMDYKQRLRGITMPHICDIISLRLTRRELERKSFRIFARACFGFLRTDLSAHSIQMLQQISQHDRIREYVHTLHVTLFLKETSSCFGSGFAWHRSAQGHLTPPLPALDAIRETLVKRFTNCRTFFFHEDTAEEPVPDEIFWDDIVSAFISMIGQVKLPVKGFHTRQTQGYGPRAQLHPDRVSLKNIQRPEFLQVWADHLEELTMKWFETDFESDFAGGLVTTAKNLRMLELRGDTRETPLLDRLIQADHSPGLTDLRLRYYYASENTLVRLLRRFRHSLRHVTFCQAYCTEGQWRCILEEMQHLQLEGFALFALREGGGSLFFDQLVDDASMQFVAWKNSWTKDKRLWGVEYAGRDAHGALRKVLDKYYIRERM